MFDTIFLFQQALKKRDLSNVESPEENGVRKRARLDSSSGGNN